MLVGCSDSRTKADGVFQPLRSTKARGRTRRKELLAAGREALAADWLHDIGMIAIAARAGIPISSAYHFFPGVNDLWKELARVVATEQAAAASAYPPCDRWEMLIDHSLRYHQRAFNHDRAARQLMLGSGTPPAIKHAGCKEDFRFGAALWSAMSAQFVLPELADSREVFFKALLVADVFFALSVAEVDQVTDAACVEAAAATTAYLGLYLPPRLARRSDEVDTDICVGGDVSAGQSF